MSLNLSTAAALALLLLLLLYDALPVYRTTAVSIVLTATAAVYIHQHIYKYPDTAVRKQRALLSPTRHILNMVTILLVQTQQYHVSINETAVGNAGVVAQFPLQRTNERRKQGTDGRTSGMGYRPGTRHNRKSFCHPIKYGRSSRCYCCSQEVSGVRWLSDGSPVHPECIWIKSNFYLLYY